MLQAGGEPQGLEGVGVEAVCAGCELAWCGGVAPCAVGGALGQVDACGGACRDGELHGKAAAGHLPPDADGAVGGVFGDIDPVDPGRYLGLDGEVAVGGGVSVGCNAAECLIEPCADAVEAVVYVAAFAVPVLPGGCGSVVEHVQEAGFVAFLEHTVEEVGLCHLDGPLGDYGYACQAGGYVAVVF